MLFLGPPVGGIDVGHAIQPLDLHFAHIAHGEVGVQCLAEGHGVGAAVVAGQADVQLVIQQQAQRQVYLMGPAWKAASRHRQNQVHSQRLAVEFGGGQFPAGGAHKTVGAGRLITLAHGFDALRVAVEHPEPRPAHRYASTNAFALLEHGLRVRPDQRLFALALVTEDMRTLLGHHQLGAVVADAPAVQLVDFYRLNVGRRHDKALLVAGNGAIDR